MVPALRSGSANEAHFQRPDLKAPALNASIQDGYEAGYIFICPYRATQTGPYIFDKTGNLVWSGYNSSEADLNETINTHQMRVCTYNGSDHLCMWKVCDVALLSAAAHSTKLELILINPWSFIISALAY